MQPRSGRSHERNDVLFCGSVSFLARVSCDDGAGPEGLAPLASVAVTVLLLNAPHAWRNFSLYGNPLGPMQELTDRGGYRYTNDIFTPAAVASNALRNAALQAATRDARIDGRIEAFLTRIHRWMALDINDARTTWPRTTFHVGSRTCDENSSGNPVHFWLVLLAGCWLAWSWRRAPYREIRVYYGALMIGFFLFAALLRWQPGTVGCICRCSFCRVRRWPSFLDSRR